MFDRFTDPAKRVMHVARRAAIALRHDVIDAAHVLLGIADEGTGVATIALRHLGVTPDALRRQIEQRVTPGKRASCAHGVTRAKPDGSHRRRHALGER